MQQHARLGGNFLRFIIAESNLLWRDKYTFSSVHLIDSAHNCQCKVNDIYWFGNCTLINQNFVTKTQFIDTVYTVLGSFSIVVHDREMS